MKRGRTRRIWLLLPVGVMVLAWTIGLVSLQPYGSLLGRLVRGAALLGYQAVFLAILSSALLKHMLRVFGSPFIRVHHILSVAGLVLLVFHPVGVAVDLASARVFLPQFESLVAFLRWGGAPALYLFVAASLAALLRKAVGRRWRVIHYLTYIAFWLGTTHGIMLGTDLQPGVVRVIPIALALVVLAILARSWLDKRRRAVAKRA